MLSILIMAMAVCRSLAMRPSFDAFSGLHKQAERGGGSAPDTPSGWGAWQTRARGGRAAARVENQAGFSATAPSEAERVVTTEKEKDKFAVLAAAPEDVERVAPMEQDKPVVLVALSMEYFEMFKNWLYFAKPFLQGKQLIVAQEDSRTAEPLKALFQQLRNEVNVTLNVSGGDPNGNPAVYGTEDFGKLVGKVPQHILHLLQQNVSVLYVDIDTVWLKDPFLDIEAAGSADLYLTKDHPGTKRPYCGCFIAARPTAATQLLMQAWAEKVEGHRSNQGVFNDELVRLREALHIEVKVFPQVKYPHGGLPPDIYSYGPTVLHANYMIGLDKKIKFLEQHGVWNPHAIEGQGNSSGSSTLPGA